MLGYLGNLQSPQGISEGSSKAAEDERPPAQQPSTFGGVPVDNSQMNFIES